MIPTEPAANADIFYDGKTGELVSAAELETSQNRIWEAETTNANR